MQNKYKDEVVKEFNGIEMERNCTDVRCLIIFLIFVLTSISLIGFALPKNQVIKFSAPLDADNNYCGVGKMEGYNKLFITSWSGYTLSAIF